MNHVLLNFILHDVYFFETVLPESHLTLKTNGWKSCLFREVGNINRKTLNQCFCRHESVREQIWEIVTLIIYIAVRNGYDKIRKGIQSKWKSDGY